MKAFRAARSLRQARVRTSAGPRHTLYMTKTFLLPILFAAALLLAPEEADAQVCQYVPHGGGESITAQVTVKDTGQAVGNGSVVAAGTNLQFDVVGDG